MKTLSLCKAGGLLLFTFLLCSCASVSVVDTWRNPAVSTPHLKKVMVVSITKKESSRRVYEDMIAAELAARGVQAIPGYTELPTGMANWEALDGAVKRASVQAVLTVQTIRVEQQTTVQPGYVTTYPGHWYPEAFPAWDLYGYYGSMANYGPAFITTYDVATMQLNLFDATNGKLIWAATVESNEPEKVVTVGKELARIVVESLSRQGLI
ncbi:DUF4136 domain-containing protein [Geomonas sp. Red32]|uniref:DUF4136 domain-containing protein n=1 Tax=Geomonas sp. Red32 TaxID=2912856 RepID=UPI00202CD61C|nr:DUF4136 domain-containing protein [Geomonas sp. Red32]MCM0081517.1 DUF4136 domain-containing protein [Geomonas sp. Red32]